MNAAVVRVSVKWLDGGLEDEFWVLTPLPCRLAELADAVEGFTGCDERMALMADCLRRVRANDVVANSPTRFVAVCGDELDWGPPNGKCVVEVQDLPVGVTGGLALDAPPVDHLVDRDFLDGASPRSRRVHKKG